ncbi:hypothetical protein EVJ58_g5445 [Rhodofomes roseus]|uniref:DUF6589 domain-containing protein n=1 Tax=Rhodofomes roseus TaxID=34475 RepID=A0A4Y9YC92_9APHY|nr:hypothetical protein EVJ58_g5445 [Rhodofomes roseus]
MSFDMSQSSRNDTLFTQLFSDDEDLDASPEMDGQDSDTGGDENSNGWMDYIGEDDDEEMGEDAAADQTDSDTGYEDNEDSTRLPQPPEVPGAQSTPQSTTQRSTGKPSKTCKLVIDILEYIRYQKRTTLANFLKEFSWGERECTKDCECHGRIIRYRTEFFRNKDFPVLFDRWCKPPRSKASRRSRPLGGRGTIIPAAEKLVRDRLKRELKKIDPLFRSADMKLTRRELTSISLPDLVEQLQTLAPTLWSLLSWLCGDEEKRRSRNPTMRNLLMVSIFLYSRSQYCGKLQKLFAIYFKFKGLTAKGCDTMHALGIVMSAKWTTNAVETLSDEAMDELRRKIEDYPSINAHDNVHVPFRVFSQRLDNRAENGHGTAATVYVKQDAQKLPPSTHRELQQQRAAGMANPIDTADILRLAWEGWPRIERHMIDYVLRVLLDSREFDMKSYPHKKDSAFARPEPVNEVPCGPDHTVLQYLLGSMDTKEQSYDDNDKVVSEILKQLGITTADVARLKELGEEKLMFWAGDQLTVDRLRGLWRFRCQDLNGFDRMDWMVIVFGWLHYQMAFGKSLHRQYLGTEAGFGLKHAFEVLRRKGLDNVSTQGPFHDNFEHALYDIMDARIRTLWLVLTGATSLADLRARAPEELATLAARIVHEYASMWAMDEEQMQKDNTDEVRRQQIMFNRDVLLYIVLDLAIKHGDIGLMEDILPNVLLRFVGGRNSKYTIESLELLQSLHREWPEGVRTFVRRHCWIINTTGKRDGHTPVDRGMEAAIKDIKVTHRPQGPHIDWEYLKKLHPTIPVIKAISEHIEQQFGTWTRYKRHTSSHDQAGILLLQQAYLAGEVFSSRPGRQISLQADRASDFVNQGIPKLPTTIGRWVLARTFPRSSSQIWTHYEQAAEAMDVDN